MAFELFKLAGSIFIDTKEADKSLSKTDDNAQGFAKTLGKVAGGAINVGLEVVNMATSVGGSLLSVAEDSASTADRVDKMSAKIGLSKEAFQEWDYVMSQNGMDISKMQTGLKTLSDQMDKAQNGTASAIKIFDDLGVSWQNADGTMRSTEDVFADAVTALANMDESATRTALAVDAFGKAGTELSPMLNTGAESIEELKDRSHELGLVMSDEAVESGVAFGDIMDDLRNSFSMLGTKLGTALLPVLTTLVSAIVDNMPMIQNMIDSFLPVLMGLFDSMLPPLLDLISSVFPQIAELLMTIYPVVGDIVSGLLPVIIEVLLAIIPPLMEVVSAVLPLLLDVVNALLPLIMALVPLLEPIVGIVLAIIEPLVPFLTSILVPLIETITIFISSVVPFLVEGLNAVGAVVGWLLGEVFENFAPVIDSVMQVLGGLITFISGVFTADFKKAGEGLLGVLKGVINLILGAIETCINTAISSINGLVKGALAIANAVPGVNLQVGEIQKVKIPKLEKGGTLDVGGSVLVGERAPEILDLPAGARVRPLDNLSSKDDMKDALVEALREVAPELRSVTEISPEFAQFFKVMRDEGRSFYDQYGNDPFSYA